VAPAAWRWPEAPESRSGGPSSLPQSWTGAQSQQQRTGGGCVPGGVCAAAGPRAAAATPAPSRPRRPPPPPPGARPRRRLPGRAGRLLGGRWAANNEQRRKLRPGARRAGERGRAGGPALGWGRWGGGGEVGEGSGGKEAGAPAWQSVLARRCRPHSFRGRHSPPPIAGAPVRTNPVRPPACVFPKDRPFQAFAARSEAKPRKYVSHPAGAIHLRPGPDRLSRSVLQDVRWAIWTNLLLNLSKPRFSVKWR
jgi:hypothetical protein